MIFGRCNLGFPYTFSESPGSIEKRYIFGFLITWHALPYLKLKHAVAGRPRFSQPPIVPLWQNLPRILGLVPTFKDKLSFGSGLNSHVFFLFFLLFTAFLSFYYSRLHFPHFFPHLLQQPCTGMTSEWTLRVKGNGEKRATILYVVRYGDTA